MLFKLAFKNVISRKSSFVIVLFMTFAVTLFCIANAVFDSTEEGIQTNYISSFTGDLIIRPKGGQNSLFGDETPVTGELTELSTLVPFLEITEALKMNKNIKGIVPQLTGAAALEFRDKRLPIYLFGVNGKDYLDLMSSVHIIEGQNYVDNEKSAMISNVIARKLEAKVGDTIQFTVADGPYFRIRAATVTAIFEYDIDNAIFENFILLDPQTLRAIKGMGEAFVETETISESKTSLLVDDLDLESLFDDAFDSDGIFEDDLSESDNAFIEESESEEVVENIPVYTSWHNIIVRLNDGASAKKTIKGLNKYFKKQNWPVEATDWRHAAGSTALYLYWMRKILNAGILVILIAGFIIVNNTLIVNVLDRTKEIGTMRAIGAKKRYISAQCMIETFMMTLSSGFLGTILGAVITKIISQMHIVFKNSFLVQLFGSDALHIFVTPQNVGKLFILVIVLGIIGWIYPVFTAVKVSPVKAMQGGK